MSAVTASTFRQGLLLPAVLLSGLTLLIAAETGTLPALPTAATGIAGPETVTLPAGRFDYRQGGDFIQGGVPVSAPLVAGQVQPVLDIMRYQVGAADYARCVADAACPEPHPRHTGKGLVPAAGVSFDDAQAYAAWLSAQTGQHWRLPTLAEWDYAADGLAADHGTEVGGDAADPAVRWLAQFEAQTAGRTGSSPDLMPAGSFGSNRLGVADMGGSVWEWTSTCHSRTRLDAAGAVLSRVESCGVRLLEGRDRMPMSRFVQDARGGGCSMGMPPDNIGFRLVREPGWFEGLLGAIRRLLA